MTEITYDAPVANVETLGDTAFTDSIEAIDLENDFAPEANVDEEIEGFLAFFGSGSEAQPISLEEVEDRFEALSQPAKQHIVDEIIDKAEGIGIHITNPDQWLYDTAGLISLIISDPSVVDRRDFKLPMHQNVERFGGYTFAESTSPTRQDATIYLNITALIDLIAGELAWQIRGIAQLVERRSPKP
jgi:hypothetical protein